MRHRNEHLRPVDGIQAVEDFNWPRIKAELESSETERDPDTDDWCKILWLGSVIALAPSGKFYTPFASGNLHACPVCLGAGTVRVTQPRTRLARKRLAARARGLAGKRSRLWFRLSEAGYAYQHTSAKLEKLRALEATTHNQMKGERSCAACNGCGSNEAATDEVFWEEMESRAESIDACLEFRDGEVFITCAADAPEGFEDEDSES